MEVTLKVVIVYNPVYLPVVSILVLMEVTLKATLADVFVYGAEFQSLF